MMAQAPTCHANAVGAVAIHSHQARRRLAPRFHPYTHYSPVGGIKWECQSPQYEEEEATFLLVFQ